MHPDNLLCALWLVHSAVLTPAIYCHDIKSHFFYQTDEHAAPPQGVQEEAWRLSGQ